MQNDEGFIFSNGDRSPRLAHLDGIAKRKQTGNFNGEEALTAQAIANCFALQCL